MHGSQISNTVTVTVDLGGAYPSPLTVTQTGAILPAAYAADAVYSNVAAVRLTNQGTIVGGKGNYGLAGASTNGGVGVNLTHGGTIRNFGGINGGLGQGAWNRGATGGYGGAGITLAAGGTLANQGQITGGTSLYSLGGTGVQAVGANITNAGIISGGRGALDGAYYRGGYPNGGDGVSLQGGHITNAGTILGGLGGSSGYSGPHGGAGGVGLDILAAASAVNRGVIAGGRGGASEYGQTSSGGAGVYIGAGGGRLVNSGDIFGGDGTLYPPDYNGGGDGGAGVRVAASATVTNSGLIAGGNGSRDVSEVAGYSGGRGGAGLDVTAAATFSNSGTILGGYGGGAFRDYLNYGGAGGDGVRLSGGATLVNHGVIAGGAGGVGGVGSSYVTLTGGAGGDGVYLDGGKLVTAGIIAGGAGGANDSGYAAPGDAVRFGSVASTLVVDPGALFIGNVEANPSAQDVLVLAGTSPGLLTGLGHSITGFTTIRETSGATWTLSGISTGPGAFRLGADAAVTIQGTAAFDSIAFGGAGGAVTLGTSYPVFSTFSGFGHGDSITIDGINAATLDFTHGVLNLYTASGEQVESLKFAGNYASPDFALQQVQGGTEVLYAGGENRSPDRIDSIMPGHIAQNPW